MSIDSLVDDAAGLSFAVVAAIGAVAAFLLVLAVGTQLSAQRLRRDLDFAEEELVDRATGLLPRSALRVRLGAEIAWAATSGTPLSVAVLRIRGSRLRHAARVLRHAMREEEAAFLLRDDRVVVELWGADPGAAASATRRLGEGLALAGHPVVDAGLGCCPRDGADVETLVAAAQRDLRPIDDPLQAGHDVGVDGRARGRMAHTVRLLAGILPWFASAGLLLLLAWRLVPAAIQPALEGDGDRTGEQLAYALIAAVGLPLGAALVHLTCWNLGGGGTAPSSRPLGPAGWRIALVMALMVAVPLAWGIAAPHEAGELAEGFGASLAVVALVLLAIFHARQLVHLAPGLLVTLVVLGGIVTWLSVETWSLPVLADAGRLLLAVALGALLARSVERVSWLVLLAVLAAGVDLWSVLADSGFSNRMLERDGGAGGDRLVELMLFTGPVVDGRDLFAIGTVDLVFIAFFLAWSHDWRLDLRWVAAALLFAAWAGILVGELASEAVPLLPFLGGAMVLLLATRSMRLRRRGRAWRPGSGPPPAPPIVTG